MKKKPAKALAALSTDAYKKTCHHQTGLKVVTQQPPPKANVIDGKWGMGKWKFEMGSDDQKKFLTAVKNANITSSSKVSYFDSDGIQVSPQKIAEIMKKKPVKIPDCGWGSEIKNHKGPSNNRTDVITTRYWDKFTHLPDGYALIQKKHLDEAAWAIRTALMATGFSESATGRMCDVLKNISVK